MTITGGRRPIDRTPWCATGVNGRAGPLSGGCGAGDARAGGPGWRQEPSLRRPSRSRAPATTAKHEAGSPACDPRGADMQARDGLADTLAELAGVAVAAYHVHHVKEYLGGTHR